MGRHSRDRGRTDDTKRRGARNHPTELKWTELGLPCFSRSRIDELPQLRTNRAIRSADATLPPPQLARDRRRKRAPPVKAAEHGLGSWAWAERTGWSREFAMRD